MLVIGLTGGIGSGKSTVCKLFAAKNIDIIDADIIARNCVSKDSPLLKKIVDHFGDTILLEDKTLNRQQLKQIIFNHHEEKLWLEALLHPEIKDQIREKLKEIKSSYVIVDIPLLIETLPYPFIDRICVVDTPEALAIERIVKRDNMTAEDIEKIMLTQVKRLTRLQYADDIIHNIKDLNYLEQQVSALDSAYRKISGT